MHVLTDFQVDCTTDVPLTHTVSIYSGCRGDGPCEVSCGIGTEHLKKKYKKYIGYARLNPQCRFLVKSTVFDAARNILVTNPRIFTLFALVSSLPVPLNHPAPTIK